jgi:ferredoxin
MKTSVDSDVCMGCGICETISPKVYRLGAQTYAIVLVDTVPADEEANVREAMDSCPEQAILIE